MLLTIVKLPNREYLYIDGVIAANRDHFSSDNLVEYTFGDLDFELQTVHYNRELDEVPQYLEDLPE